MKFGVVVFPGSNCDDDMIHVLGTVLGQEVRKIWHKETHIDDFRTGDCIVLPGGFSFGDYLRSGAIASHSPIMKAVIQFANEGGYVLGVCNGFQILCETGLLPGALLANSNQKFICKNVYLKPTTTQSPITQQLNTNQAYKIPIAHAEGRYFAAPEVLEELEANDQILFQYCDQNAVVSPEANPNGAMKNIAGITNKQRNVFGMMPHPERAAETELGNEDGKSMLLSLIAATLQEA